MGPLVRKKTDGTQPPKTSQQQAFSNGMAGEVANAILA
jgi:hypothetical protein